MPQPGREPGSSNSEFTGQVTDHWTTGKIRGVGVDSLVADLPVPEFYSQLKKKTREKSRRKSNIVQFGRWRDSFSSALCSILSKSTLFQPMTACVISELYYKSMQEQSAGIKCKNNLLKPCKWHCAFGQNNCVRPKLCLS